MSAVSVERLADWILARQALGGTVAACVLAGETRALITEENKQKPREKYHVMHRDIIQVWKDRKMSR